MISNGNFENFLAENSHFRNLYNFSKLLFVLRRTWVEKNKLEIEKLHFDYDVINDVTIMSHTLNESP